MSCCRNQKPGMESSKSKESEGTTFRRCGSFHLLGTAPNKRPQANRGVDENERLCSSDSVVSANSVVSVSP